MKKILFIFGVLGILGGCTSVSTQNKFPQNNQEMIVNGKNGYIGKLITKDNWESAIFIEGKNKSELVRMISGDGIKMGNNNMSIHFKNNIGILERKK